MENAVPVAPPPSPASSMNASIDELKKPSKPAKKMSDDLSGRIIKLLSMYNYPLGAGFIANKLSEEKKVINSALYKMNKKEIVQVDHIPPLWALKETNFRMIV